MTLATRAAVLEHVAAFNAHDADRVVRGLADDVVWATGSDVLHGRAALRGVFDDWLWGMSPRLDVRSLIVEGDRAAMECVESMTVDGRGVEFAIAVHVTVRGGVLAGVKVYREGTADVIG